MKIAMIGGRGNVGKQTLQRFYTMYAERGCSEPIHITSVSRNPGAVKAQVLQIQQTILADDKYSAGNPFRTITTHSTSDYTDIEQADLVVVLSHIQPTEELQADLAAQGIKGRFTFSYLNRDLIRDISDKIALYAPRAHVILVSNQSDLLAQVARQSINPQNVLGFGGSLDSMRMRHWLKIHSMDSQGKVDEETRKRINRVHIVGYHDDDSMIPLESTTNIPEIGKNVIRAAFEKTRGEGWELAQMVVSGHHQSSEFATDIMPGYALAITMAAYAGVTGPIVGPHNVVLPPPIASHWGVESNTGLSIPVTINKGGYKIVDDLAVTPREREIFAEKSSDMDELFKHLEDWSPASPRKPEVRPSLRAGRGTPGSRGNLDDLRPTGS